MKIEESLYQRIRLGAAVITAAKGARWYKDIDLEELDMILYTKCLLGQLYGNFAMGVKALGITHAQAVTYGFACAKPSEYKALTLAWKLFIQAQLESTRVD